jgi:type I restriction enzyme M protein
MDNGMIGAIVGDIVGSRFEWHNRKSKRFTFLKGAGESRHPCRFTDDSVMTLAVADAIMKWREAGGGSYDALSAEAVTSMQEFGRRYPRAGYGGAFRRWLGSAHPEPYNSWGNGAAMRVSACGWAGRTLEEVKAMSRAVTEVTHNHPEGVKGAEATAVATFLARTGKSMDEIKEVVVRNYYPLDFTLDEIRPGYEFDVSCQGSVPQALEAFFESTSFEDAIRNAISIGGDSDTLGAICGAVAGAYYGVPNDIREKAETFLDGHLLKTLNDFERTFAQDFAVRGE